MSWKQVLIERLINQTYDYVDGEFRFVNADGTEKPHVFRDGTHHEKWYYSYGTFETLGLKKFDEDGHSTNPNSHRKAISDPIEYDAHLEHPGATMSEPKAIEVERIVRDTQSADGLFGEESGDGRHDVFHAVRAKLHHVYDEGIYEGRVEGGGTILHALGDEAIFSDVVQYVKDNLSGGGPATRAEFDKMLTDLSLVQKLADHPEVPMSASDIQRGYDAAGGQLHFEDHDSW